MCIYFGTLWVLFAMGFDLVIHMGLLYLVVLGLCRFCGLVGGFWFGFCGWFGFACGLLV